MTPRLPIILTGDDLPLTELVAARLDGELYTVGQGFAPIDEIEQPEHRARSLVAGIHDRFIAEQRLAAWIWGAAEQAPARHEFCVRMGARVSHSIASWQSVREVVIEPFEIATVGGLPLTSPLRTAIDLVRFVDTFTPDDAGVVSKLMAFGRFDRGDCFAELNRRRNLPNKRRAAQRLMSCGP